LLRALSWDASLANQASIDDEEAREGPVAIDGYGYGWMTGPLAGSDVTAYLHPGGNAGFRTVNCVIPDREACLVILCNDESTDMTGLTAEVLDVYLT
jgi:hypothetical protein